VLLPTRHEWAFVLASAALFALAFPPIPLVVPAFLCLVPLAVAVARVADEGGTARDAARLGFWFGALAFGVTLYWIAFALLLFTKLALLGYAATVLGHGMIFAGVAAALFAVRRLTRLPMAVLLPVVWAAGEVGLNRLHDIAFPWLPLGLSLARVPLLAQMVDLSGVRGASFWIAAVNGLLADAWIARDPAAPWRAVLRGRPLLRRAAIIAASVALVAAYGAWRLRTLPTRALAPIAAVQPNIPQEDKWQEENRDRIVGMLASLTRDEMRESEARLVVWPEVALPGYLVDHPEWRDTLRALATVEGTPILFGVLDVEFRSRDDYEYYNAAMVTDTAGVVGRQEPYRKGYLVPIVERVPFLNPRWFGGMKYFGGFGRGSREIPFDLTFGRGGVLICYESIFPQRARAFRRNGADLLINITNDAWFGRSLAPHQHHAHLLLRAIENRVGIVRSANTGISGYIDPLGRGHGETELFVAATPTYDVRTSEVRTLYVRAGDWVGVLSTAATVLGVLAYAARRRRGTGAPPRDPLA
jgi:apolipoprotein N-acyltransferase